MNIIKERLALNSFQLKILGIMLMVFDHVHQFFVTDGAPLWFTWLGRIVAPIFLFTLAEGVHYTRSKLKYLLHLYVGYLLILFMSHLISYFMPSDMVLINNIFGTLFLSGLYIVLIDRFIAAVKIRKWKTMISSFLLMLVPIIWSLFTLLLLMQEEVSRTGLYINSLFPSLVAVEGGFIYVLLGIVFYYLRKYRIAQIASLVALSVLVGFASPEPMTNLDQNFQWLMVIAAIPIYLYNGQKGKNMKYFFYIFYPVHIYFLYILAYVWNS
ncbi:hypothetical protein GK047_16920 [Paenibacillus sp. SYP-B3998]|uniref:Conjugal transfer protein TraX n=1 Tax=Paenibacillus sp. SYP-B3998 TaxID=2678564 RepID=A0A6G3ZZZ4_9BACL|nr:TraX family protein [Paenibacillus sp. SYP-B3998]NEW07685.1 hypothetical protein [Paenibacillus sp. SYP-B3998]